MSEPKSEPVTGEADDNLDLEAGIAAFVGKTHAIIQKARESMSDEEVEIADRKAAEILAQCAAVDAPEGEANRPTFSTLKENIKLRMLANMATDAPCFTNAILAVTDAYCEGWAESLATPPPTSPKIATLLESYQEVIYDCTHGDDPDHHLLELLEIRREQIRTKMAHEAWLKARE